VTEIEIVARENAFFDNDTVEGLGAAGNVPQGYALTY